MKFLSNILAELPLFLKGQSATPAAPPSGYIKLYSKTDGRLYARTPGGEIAIPYGNDVTAPYANPDFEDTPVLDGVPYAWNDFWGSGSGKKTRTDNANYLTGSYSAKFTMINGGGAILGCNPFTVVGGTILTFVFYAISDDPVGGLRAELLMTSDGSDPGYFGATITTIMDSWKPVPSAAFGRLTFTVQIPDGMTKATINFRPTGSAGLSTSAIWLDSTTASVQESSVDPTPTGAVLDFAGATAPAGYLMCDGTSYLRGDYAALFAVIGTTFGSADSTHFNVPDKRDKVSMGKSGTKALGTTGGAASVTLVEANLPPHAHTIAHTHDISHTHTMAHTHDMAHTHTINHGHALITGNAAGGSTLAAARSNNTTNVTANGPVDPFSGNSGGVSTPNTGASSAANTGAASTSNSGASSATNSGNGAGTSTAFSIIQPYVALNSIIKT